MSSLYNQTAGAIKETVGNIVGNNDLVETGREQWAESKGEQKIQENRAHREKENPELHRAVDSANNISGTAKEMFGQAIGDKIMEAEGHSQRTQAKGNAMYHDKLTKDNTKAGI
ncbi:hypothetical protein GGF37_002644 [Kickxella alabastrina]|nr:hypothetical protein GGF37_002644 [Kickxella alabastrina]